MRRRAILAGFATAALVTGGISAASAQVMDEEIYAFAATDEFEYAPGGAAELVRYDAKSWIGGDYTRIWFKAEGEHFVESGVGGDTEVQALLGRLIAPFWELQAGVRVDVLYGDEGDDARALLAIGLQGLARYWFEVEPFLYVSRDGDVSVELEASYELLLTQRLIAEPELEAGLSFRDLPEFGVAAGFNEIELALRIRYEIVREVAPYIGFAWARLVGGTADLAREEGESVDDASIVAGLRLWY